MSQMIALRRAILRVEAFFEFAKRIHGALTSLRPINHMVAESRYGMINVHTHVHTCEYTFITVRAQLQRGHRFGIVDKGVGSTDIVISHSKANSSPASLDAPVCAAVNSDVPSHVHQKSLDIAADYTHGYCPEVSFCDFRKQGFIQSDSEAQTPPFSCRPRLKFAVRELPAWFEMTQNEKNQVYFLNHETQETTWFDPRIPVGHQKWGMTLDELQQVHINYARYLGQNPPNVGQYRPSVLNRLNYLEIGVSLQPSSYPKPENSFVTQFPPPHTRLVIRFIAQYRRIPVLYDSGDCNVCLAFCLVAGQA
ncbi:hypothetical protein CLF_102571 [Clonorchis sinensis]|uniref:WW domain-containing protein n=1 Tax=Clonorchis sinensis TaxID=79923 RepID=G7Y852_CLOSI|nr:hypothetical protein CLF_102571 [Clonorchis sinensis]